MLKTTLRTVTLTLSLLLIACVPALALHEGVQAAPNQKLRFRTGPNTAYTDLYVLPKSTPIVAIEYVEGNGVTWVLCDFEYKGSRVRGYVLEDCFLSPTNPPLQHLF